ncbi:DUF475 domain-containing protein [Nakamurella aerolata]|uniref:DUF475 domain-containing protein n=1 Tax=Nakamurella aerolata TaxID=1656892 RepID=A0A849A4B4_9ACTN|nr:DUF475 domain-containing protein [Nakamurella aerolata]NNG35439.1 DUF475 domain-containing protein [Nakamurella aerolata]
MRIFFWSILVTIASLITAFIYGSWTALALCLILGILEISLSFDNAVVNAKILERMSEFWQKLFLTVGIVIAVFGMRILFPVLIVGITAKLNPIEAWELAMKKLPEDDPNSYAHILEEAHPQIGAFGGMFLLMLFLDWIFEDRDIKWLRWIEAPLAKLGKLDTLSIVVAGVVLVITAQLADDRHYAAVLMSGILGLLTYLAVNGLSSLFESAGDLDDDSADETAPATGPAGTVRDPDAVAANATVAATKAAGTDPAPAQRRGPTETTKAVGKAGFFLFLYLEVLDASFSFDGVIGAFAITSDPIIIALGLGLIGAMFVRSLTVFLVRKGTLSEYVYLEHGAHWAIGALAAILLLSIGIEINEVITGLLGVAFIGAAFASSLLRNKRLRAHGIEPEHLHA